MRPVIRKKPNKINRSIKKKICLDFDGTIYPNKYKDNRIDNSVPPTDGFIEFYLAAIRSHTLIVNSARCESDEQIKLIESYLRDNGIPMKVSKYKPMAHYYVDDKGVSYGGDWGEVARVIRI